MMETVLKNRSERTTGLYRLITIPRIYELVQNTLGSERARLRHLKFLHEHFELDRVLDIGCGPGYLAAKIRAEHYTGIDINPNHISTARTRHPAGKYSFYCADASDLPEEFEGQFTCVISGGFLHHLNDEQVIRLLMNMKKLTAPGASIAIREPVYIDRQHGIARALMWLDSGKYIRTKDQYLALLKEVGMRIPLVELMSGDLRVPYNHFVARAQFAE